MKNSQNVPAADPQKGTAEEYNNVQRVVAVMSGKGGVGKSFVTGLLASGLARQGYQVGILDADITGPSIPMLFGLHGPVDLGDYGIMPLKSRTGIKVISMNLLLKTEDQPVIWRGPLVSRGIRQLWGDVMWGDLDILLIDLPPGTSDATLTIMQSLPLNGLVMVTTPQSLASMVVTKAINMAHVTKVDIIGIVENMAYFDPPESDKRHYIFGGSHAEELAQKADAPVLAQIPIDPKISKFCDAGNMEEIQIPGLDTLVEKFLIIAETKEEIRRIAQQADVEIPGKKRVSTSTEVGRSAVDEEHEPELDDYSPIARKIIDLRENMGRFDKSDLAGKITGCCGDSITIDLLLDEDIIRDARFTTDGCSATIACGGMLTRMIKGLTLDQARALDSSEVIQALRGLPKGHLHCAELAIKTLRHTIESKGKA